MKIIYNYGISLTGAYGPTYRAGGLWNRGLTVGRSAMINNNGDGVDDISTWVHESYHYYQQLTQGWARQFTNGVNEQWWLYPFKGIKVYDLNYGNKYNESAAENYTKNFFNR